jgi:N-acetylglucosamine repressor
MPMLRDSNVMMRQQGTQRGKWGKVVRGDNRTRVIWSLLEHGPLRRREIARSTGLTDGAISRVTAELLSNNFITEEPIKSHTGGRPATQLRLGGSLLAVGVDLHPKACRLAVSSLDGTFIEEAAFETPKGIPDLLRLIVQRVKIACRHVGETGICGVGISSPGIVNNQLGIIHSSRALPWSGTPVQSHLQDCLGLPVLVENNASAAALGELWYGSATTRAAKRLLYVHVDEGVGGAVVRRRPNASGFHVESFELGHVIVSERAGPIEHYESGSLEQFVSDPAIVARFHAASRALDLSESMDSSEQVRAICQYALDRDPAALVTLREVAHYLGIGILNAAYILNPGVVVLEGALTKAWPVIRPVIESVIPRSPKQPGFDHLKLECSQLSGSSPLRGVISACFQRAIATLNGVATKLPIESTNDK